MKKDYQTPDVEKIEFNYRDQVIAASTGCGSTVVNVESQDGTNPCTQPTVLETHN